MRKKFMRGHTKMNNKAQAGWIALAVVVGLILITVLWVMGSYNGLVSKDENVNQKWGNVQTAYQRRADLIPNLVETVKGAKNFEQETMTKIAELRSQAGQAKIDVGNAQDVAALQAAGAQMNSVLSKLMVIVEAYPELKATQNFMALQDELAGTENRIKYERDEYNTAVKDYRVSVRRFPTNVIAGMFGFSADAHETFAADEAAQNAPKVTFEP